MDKVIKTLEERILKTNINNPKANRGHVELKVAEDYPAKLQDWVAMSINLMVRRLHENRRGEESGQTKLTALSASIGTSVISQIAENYTTSAAINVGDAIIGAFVTNGYITVRRIKEDTSVYSQSTAPYFVEPTETFVELTESPLYAEKPSLQGTSLEPIAKITQVVQANARPVVKQLKDEREVEVKRSIEEGDPWVLAADTLQGTAWKINQRAVEVLTPLWQNYLPDIPVKPSHGDKASVADALKVMKKDDTQANRDAYNVACEEWNDMLMYLSAISKRADRNATWAKIQKLKDAPEFYQYVDFDTRGRVYYQEHSLNFQGSDWARGLMQFSKGKALNARGKYWLAVHTANSFNVKFPYTEIPSYFTYDYQGYMAEQGLENISLDKLTLDDRVAWVWENMFDIILPSAINFNDEAEKPVSFLSCCLEWAGVINDPEHISYLPLPIDGSNNGYQHSGAIAKDEMTAGYVGLSPSEIPRDLYMVCARELMVRCPEFFKARPTFTMSEIRKAIAKRGTMTRAYSAGATTMAENMYKDCHKEGYTKKYNISMLDCEGLAKELYALIGDVCPGATQTMDFLQDLVMFELGEFAWFDIATGEKVSKTARKKLLMKRKKLNKLKPDELTTAQLTELNTIKQKLETMESRKVRGNGKNIVNWDTPTGFPACSDYKIQRSVKILSSIPGFIGGAAAQPGRVRHVLVEDTIYPDRNKYVASISPNFIHSLDSSHLLSVVHAWNDSFGAVHDSFSVHPNDIDELLEITKDTFIKLYDVEDPYVEIANLITTDAVDFDVELPEYGQYNLEELRKSDFFFC